MLSVSVWPGRKKSHGSGKNNRRKKSSQTSSEDLKRSWDSFNDGQEGASQPVDKNVKTRRISEILSQGPRPYHIHPVYKTQLLASMEPDCGQTLVETVADSVDSVGPEVPDLDQELQANGFDHDMLGPCDMDIDEDNAVSQLLCPQIDNVWDSDEELEPRNCDHAPQAINNSPTAQPSLDRVEQTDFKLVSEPQDSGNNQNPTTAVANENCKVKAQTSGAMPGSSDVGISMDEQLPSCIDRGVNHLQEGAEAIPNPKEESGSIEDLDRSLFLENPAPQAQPGNEKIIESGEAEQRDAEVDAEKATGAETEPDVVHGLECPSSHVVDPVTQSSSPVIVAAVQENSFEGKCMTNSI